jgi:hypothetical protein
MAEVRKRRALNDIRPVSLDDKWAQVAGGIPEKSIDGLAAGRQRGDVLSLLVDPCAVWIVMLAVGKLHAATLRWQIIPTLLTFTASRTVHRARRLSTANREISEDAGPDNHHSARSNSGIELGRKPCKPAD